MAEDTALTAGYIYVCNHLTGADGDAQRIDLAEVGQDWFNILIPVTYQDRDKGDIDKEIFYGNEGYFIRYDAREEVYIATGKVNTRTEVGYVKSYWGRQNDGRNQDPDYLFVMHGANDFFPFSYSDGTLKEYARGFMQEPQFIWLDSEHEKYTVIFKFHVVWGT